MQTAVRAGKAIQTLRQLLIQPQYIPDRNSPIHHARWQPDNAKLEMSWTRCSSSSSRPPPRDRERSPSGNHRHCPTTTLCSSSLRGRLLAVGPKGNTTIGNDGERWQPCGYLRGLHIALALFRSEQNAWFSSRPDSSQIAWGGEVVELPRGLPAGEHRNTVQCSYGDRHRCRPER